MLDDTNLKMTFRRNISVQPMTLWGERVAIVGSISYSDAHDSLIWELSSQGIYSVHSLCHY